MTRTALIPTLVPNQTLVKQIGLVVGGAALTAVLAQVSIPWEPVPFTLQTLAVTLCGITLGWRLGLMSQIAYLAAGAAGLPIFANGAFGAHRLFGETAGYLWAFVLAAGLLGWLAEKGWDRKVGWTALALGLANLLILGLGMLWLSVFYGIKVAFATGFAPFITGAIAKSLVVVATMPFAWKLVGKDKA
jgi:biotin transport system substrate-specific component